MPGDVSKPRAGNSRHRLAGVGAALERFLFRRLFGGLPVDVQDVLERAAAQPSGEGMVATLVDALRPLSPADRLAWAAAADELPNRTSVSAYWVSLVALLLATAGLASGFMRVVLLVATACGIFLTRYQSRHASRLRVPGNVLRSLVGPDGCCAPLGRQEAERGSDPPCGDRAAFPIAAAGDGSRAERRDAAPDAPPAGAVGGGG